MPCELGEVQRLVRQSAISWEPNKAVLAVANRRQIAPKEAKALIKALILELKEEDFDEPGDGEPYPPCDVYRITRTYYEGDGRWDNVTWYVKFGIDRKNAAAPFVWVESCHWTK
jgi:hypothetical protein